MRKILLGTASLLAASTVLFSSINAQAASTAVAALTATSSDYDLTTVFGPKMTPAGVKAFVIALAQEPASGAIGIKGFNVVGTAGVGSLTGSALLEGFVLPKSVDTIANRIGAATNWNVFATPLSVRMPLVATTQTTFSANQWLQAKLQSCAIGSFSRSYTQSTNDPSIYIAVDTFNPLTASTVAYQTYDTGLEAAEAAEAAAAFKDTTFFTTMIPASIATSASAIGDVIPTYTTAGAGTITPGSGATATGATVTAGVSAATFNVYVKPAVAAAFSPTATPSIQYIEYVISCFGTYQSII